MLPLLLCACGFWLHLDEEERLRQVEPPQAGAACLRTGATIRRVRSVRRVCYAGTYEREYPRNALIVQALHDSGVRVEEAHVPVFERRRDKSGVALVGLVGLVLRLMLAYLRLVPDVALRMLRCDVLMVGYIGQLDMLVLGPVARLLGKPVVFNPLVSLTDTLVEDRKRFRPDSVPGSLVNWIDRAALRGADLVLADTQENADYFAHTFDLDPDRLAVVQVGAPEDVFYPACQASRSTELDVLFVGKFIPLHGVDTILRAASLLQRRGVAARIELVGRGQEYDSARRLAAELGLKNVIWTDWIPFDALGDRLREADVVLGVFDGGSKAARVIPNKVHHALACGTAVVTRECPAVERFLVHGESALLVPPADPDALATAIEVLQDDATRTRIARAGHESWQEWGSQAALAFQVGAALDRLAAQQ